MSVRPDTDPIAEAMAADLARELFAALEQTSEFRCAARAAVALADGQAALTRARMELRDAQGRLDLAVTAARDPRPHRTSREAAKQGVEDLTLWVLALEREHLRAKLELVRRRDAVRRELLRRYRADVATRCGTVGDDLRLLDAVEERLCEVT